jgi:glucose-6-phosphate isomerase
MTLITIDYGNMVASNLANEGIESERLDTDLAVRFGQAYESVEEDRASGKMGFFDLPYASDALALTQEIANSYQQWLENVVIIGVGGSALGARAIKDALLDSFWNEKSNEDRDHCPRFYVIDNVDPITVRDLIGNIDISRTLFNVVSKSGSTVETMALYLVLEGMLIDELGPEKARDHFLFTTDPTDGPLRVIADREGISSLSIPSNVGGRFSVLSPVGLFPASMVGINGSELLTGAARAEERCKTPILKENPAGLIATLLHTAHIEHDAFIHVLMPYSDRLCSFSAWFQQLWAESLGKAYDLKGKVVNTGPTLLPAVGVADQHSQLQLFIEGPRNKVVIFLAITGESNSSEVEDLEIPCHRKDMDLLGHLGSHGLGDLLDAERRATAEALRLHGRPNMTLELEKLDAESLGELFMLLSIATVYAGALYGVNPLNQPGVELIKDLTDGVLGRPGHDVPNFPATDIRWRI